MVVASEERISIKTSLLQDNIRSYAGGERVTSQGGYTGSQSMGLHSVALEQ
jgi:hypothetical protein